MEKKLKSQKLKRYALIVIWILVAAGLIFGITISGNNKDNNSNDPLQENGNAVVQNDQRDGESDEQTPSEQDVEETETSDTEQLTEDKDNSPIENEAEDETEGQDMVQPDEEEDQTAETRTEPEQETLTAYIQILCYTLSNDMSQLENEAIAKYIPSNGVMLGRTAYTAVKGETVYDALSAVCKGYGIQLDANYKSSYGSVYVEGIGYLYEFDAGPQSGWMYSVNGKFPNYGSSSYELSDGDEIKWLYTCAGLGSDL